jgi:long-chain acyl-CoA synthetase
VEKVWLNNYKANIPAEIVQDDTTIIDLFEKACKTYSNNRAVTCHNVSLTFRDVRDRVSRVAEGLARLGVIRGDRVAIILPNSIQYPISVFAIHALGAAVVNINPLYTAAEIEFVVKDSSPKVIITLDMFAEKLNGFHNKYGIEHIVLSKIADPYPVFKRTLIGLILRYISKVKPKLNYTPKMWLDLYHNDNTLNDYAKISYEDIAFIQYTGATTGHPKGAMLLHRNIVSNIKQIFAVLDAQVAEMDKQIVITALPLYHIFSLTANLYTFSCMVVKMS